MPLSDILIPEIYFDKNLSYLLSNSKWSNASLAREINVSSSQIKRYLDEGQQPKIELVVAMAKALDINLDDFVLLDLTKNKARPFGNSGDDTSELEATLKEVNHLQKLRIAELEREIKETDPELAKKLGIE